jgi:hypothetical protein
VLGLLGFIRCPDWSPVLEVQTFSNPYCFPASEMTLNALTAKLLRKDGEALADLVRPFSSSVDGSAASARIPVPSPIRRAAQERPSEVEPLL